MKEKFPIIELRFLRKIKKTKLLAAICIVMTLILSYVIYASEYKYSNDKSSLATAVSEFTTSLPILNDVYILETKEIDGTLITAFKDQSNAEINGIALFLKGINQRYRIIHVNTESSVYSSVIQISRFNIKDEPYYAIYGYNLSDEIKYYGLDYYAYKSPGYPSEDRVREVITFDVKNQQFLEIYQKEELDSLFEESTDNNLYNPHLATTSMYDADGREITDNYKIQSSVEHVTPSISKMELFLLNVYIVIIIGLGIVFTRYFLIE